MFRSFFIYLSKSRWARGIVTHCSVARRVAARFIAGDSLEDAIRAIQALNAKGINATLDLLGENTTTPDEARQSSQEIVRALQAIDQAGVRSNVSVKLTQLGLAIDKYLCGENLAYILERAALLNSFMRVDMEDSSVTQATLDLVMQMRKRGFRNTGIVIQSYLYRSEKDVPQLIGAGVPVRLCKGAYKEPVEVAYAKKGDVDAAFDRLSAIMISGALGHDSQALSADGKIPPLPALATHDVQRINRAKDYAEKIRLPKQALEFQMLYGIRRDLQEQLTAEGYPVRVYVPFGTHWYPYFMRRLGERPENLWFIVTNFFRK
jgi:proline dehydrogenase